MYEKSCASSNHIKSWKDIHGKYDYEIKLVYDDQFADLQKLKKEKEAQSR